MATIKSYTDLEQSKKLAEVLPLESADCFWDYDDLQKYSRISWFEEGYEKDSQLRTNENNVPAWSLASLLGVLPYPFLSELSNEIWKCGCYPSGICYYVAADSPIDACYNMIIKLHELKML